MPRSCFAVTHTIPNAIHGVGRRKYQILLQLLIPLELPASRIRLLIVKVHPTFSHGVTMATAFMSAETADRRGTEPLLHGASRTLGLPLSAAVVIVAAVLIWNSATAGRTVDKTDWSVGRSQRDQELGSGRLPLTITTPTRDGNAGSESP